MSKNKSYNPSAFPIPVDQPYGDGLKAIEGMSLRDYFAGQVISVIPLRDWIGHGDDEKVAKAWAKLSYQVADSMLEERKKWLSQTT